MNLSSWTPPNYIEKGIFYYFIILKCLSIVYLARVVYGYDAARADELTLVEDAIVYILRKNEDGWFEGILDGVTGMFPGNYVEPI